MYKGKKYTLSDGKGNVIEDVDTRVLAEESKLALSKLDKKFTLRFHEKLGFQSKEKAERKIMLARTGVLDDKKEEAELLKKDKAIKSEYEKRKALVLNAKDCDACHAAIYADLT